jgi:hypothetical protein
LKITGEFKSLDVLRWEVVSLDVESMRHMDDLPGLISIKLQEAIDQAEDKPLALRVELRGQSELHRKFRIERERILQECQSVATGLSSDGVWIEKVVINTQMPSGASEHHGLSEEAAEAILSVFAEAKKDPKLLSQIDFDMEDVRGKLPADLRTAQLDEYLDGSSTLLELANERLLELLGSPSEESR